MKINVYMISHIYKHKKIDLGEVILTNSNSENSNSIVTKLLESISIIINNNSYELESFIKDQKKYNLYIYFQNIALFSYFISNVLLVIIMILVYNYLSMIIIPLIAIIPGSAYLVLSLKVYKKFKSGEFFYTKRFYLKERKFLNREKIRLNLLLNNVALIKRIDTFTSVFKGYSSLIKNLANLGGGSSIITLIGFVSTIQIEIQISQGMLLFGILFFTLIIIPSILNINYGFKKESIIKKNLKILKNRKEYYKNLKKLRNKIKQVKKSN